MDDVKKVKIAKIAAELANKYDNYKKEVYEPDCNYDLVYILKESEENEDLRYSLRSIDKFCNFNNVWIVGYKPSWVKNVKYIETKKESTKWVNIKTDIKKACQSNDISENFILMNDDFLVINPVIDWKSELNVCLGDLYRRIGEINPKTTFDWLEAFKHTADVLEKIHGKNFYDFEAHLPILINKYNFLNVLKIKEVNDYWDDESKVFHQRSVYKNIYPEEQEPKKIRDVKMSHGRDLFSTDIERSKWLSFPDDMIGNEEKYPKLNEFLHRMFPNKSQFEA